MLDHVCSLAIAQGVTERLQAVHCDLGRMEWAGTRELAEKQCFTVWRAIARYQSLAGSSVARGRARDVPSSTTRYCTSDHKRAQASKVITRLVNDHIATYGEHVRVLNCMGLRAQESSARAKKAPFERNALEQYEAYGRQLAPDS